jgi:hypothetical protein
MNRLLSTRASASRAAVKFSIQETNSHNEKKGKDLKLFYPLLSISYTFLCTKINLARKLQFRYRSVRPSTLILT